MKFTPVKVVRKGWTRRSAEVEFTVKVDGENSVTFKGSSAEALANGYCKSLEAMYEVIGLAMESGGNDPVEMRSRIVDHLFARTVEAFTTKEAA